MMKKFHDPFTALLPHLDLHGETVESSKFLINTFINDNIKLKNNKIVIIHGRSTGILRKATQDALKNSKNVLKYNIDPLNDGQTIVILKNKEIKNISKMSQKC